MEPERILLYNAHIYTVDGDWPQAWLLTDGKTIDSLSPGEPPAFLEALNPVKIDARGNIVLPGFIDLHVHGAVGYEVMDADAERMHEMARFYARHGVTAFLPTTWTAPRQAIWDVLECIRKVRGPVDDGATILGVHMEGPYLNPSKTGAQDQTLIRRADRDEALPFLDTGLVKLITIAPEFPENLWLIDECKLRGITVSAGHTAAGLAEMQRAVDHGLSHVTHTFNAMQGFGHRELGTVGAALAITELNCELIADNIHVHPAAQKILVDMKSPARVTLVTDAIRATGMPDGGYQIDQRTITVKGGEVRLPDGTIAGSVLTMEKALQHIVENSGRLLGECWVMSSLNAAREIGLAWQKGSLEAGKDADLVLLDTDYQVLLTVVEGRIVYQTQRD